MYYIEKMINGVLFCKTSPDGDWMPCSLKVVSARLESEKDKNRLLTDALKNIAGEIIVKGRSRIYIESILKYATEALNKTKN